VLLASGVLILCSSALVREHPEPVPGPERAT
jgi:hypothetical protein